MNNGLKKFFLNKQYQTGDVLLQNSALPAPGAGWVSNGNKINNTSKLSKLLYGDAILFDWTTQTSNFGTSIIYALTYGNGLYVAGGTGALRRSLNLLNYPAPTISIPTGYTAWFKT